MPAKKSSSNHVPIQEFNSDEIMEELATIKKLIVVLLAKLGSDSSEIGEAIHVSPSTLRNWISFNGIVSIVERAGKKETSGRKRKSKKANKVIARNEINGVAKPTETELEKPS